MTSIFDCAGWKLQPGLIDKAPVHDLLDGLLGEVEPDLAAIGFRLAMRVIVNLNDDVALFGQRSADAIGQESGQVAGSPAAQAAMNRIARTAKAGVTRPRLGLIALAGLARRIDEGQDVMDDTAVARPVLDGRDVLILFEMGGDDETTIDVVAAGRDGEIRTDVDDEVGRAELPVVRELRWGRQVGRVSLGCVGLGPGDQRRDLVVAQTCGRP